MKHHILLVEDDEQTRHVLACRLEYAGYTVTQAESGERAQELLEQGPFDVVLLDIILGGINGLEVLRLAREQPYHPEVILLTGFGSLDSALTALRGGAYDYLLKPCPSEKLLACVEGAVRRHTAEQHLCDAVVTLMPALSHYRDTERGTTREPPEPQGPAVQSEGVLRVGALSVGTTRYDVVFNDEPIHVTPTEFALLRYLAQRSGQVCLCGDIVRYTHGLATNESDAQTMLRSHVRNIRRKIPRSYLVNNRGTGYMLVAPSVIEDR